MNETFPSNTTSAPAHIDNKLSHLQIFTAVLQTMICAFGVVGNGLVIFVTGFKIKKTVNTVWFLNLAVADFLFTFFLIFGVVHISRNYDWPFGDFMCKFYSFLFMLNMFASIFLLTAISLDRCLATLLAVWAHNKRTLVKARIACFFIWVAAIICSLPYTIYRKTTTHKQTTYCYQDLRHKLPIYRFQIVFRFVLGFLIPLIIITSCYVAIVMRVRRLQQKTTRTFKTILAVILAFFLCWLPFHILRFLDLWVQEKTGKDEKAKLQSFRELLNTLINLVGTLAYLNSCLNPFLYVFMCEEFKTKLKQSLVAVFESAFAEDHLALRLSQSFTHRKSHTQNTSGQEDTQLSNM